MRRRRGVDGPITRPPPIVAGGLSIAEHERLPVHRDDGLGQQELGETGRARAGSVRSSSESTAETSAVPRWSL